MKMEKRKRLVILDWMKAVAIFCIIITHTDLLSRDIPMNYVLNCLIVAMAVPIFMIISGYNMMNSQLKCGRLSWRELYDVHVLKHQIARILPAYTIIFLIETEGELMFGGGRINSSNLLHYILLYFVGGKGPGGYYVPIMIQMFLVMPMISILIAKRPVSGLFFTLALNSGFEIVVRLISFPAEIYRLFIGRYLFLLAMGAFFRMIRGQKVKTRYLFGSLVIGLLYACVTNHFRLPDGTYSWSLFKYWQITAFPVAFYLFPFFYLLIRYLHDVQIKTWFGAVMQKIGSCTWYIYCVQMFYFFIVYEMCGFKVLLRHIPLVFELIVSFLICGIGGYLLYVVEKWIRKKVVGGRGIIEVPKKF